MYDFVGNLFVVYVKDMYQLEFDLCFDCYWCIDYFVICQVKVYFYVIDDVSFGGKMVEWFQFDFGQ